MKFKGLAEDKHFDDSHCFLCGDELNQDNQSNEHVVPLWILRKHCLLDDKLGLLNRSKIPYRKLTIPCCSGCNNNYLSVVENRVKTAIERGAGFVRAMEKLDLYLWLAKIFYGLFYKELFLSSDPKRRNANTISSPEFMQKFECMHIFLQAYMGCIEFKDFSPGSLFVFKTQSTGYAEQDWDIMDSPIAMSIGIRIGEVGIIAVLSDGEAVENLCGDSIRKAHPYPLHPIQFRELFARITYQSLLFNRTPKYIFTQETSSIITVCQLPLAGFSEKPFFDKWINIHYAKTLSDILQLPLDYVYNEFDDSVWSCLFDEKREPRYINLNDNPTAGN